MNDEPLLLTDRFELWRPAAADLPGMCRILADEQTRRYLGPGRADRQAQFDRLMRNAGSWMLHGYGSFAVREKGGTEIVASCGVFHSWRGFGPQLGMDDVPEAGWIVRADHCGRGIAREVMEAVLAWFDREHGPRRIGCMIEEGNTASERLAARLGFVRYGEHETCDGDERALLQLLERLPAATDH
ncbi:GNAT family N-acetyltransferase [Novosphingobium sp. BL-52-GroH]|uniref:GNAT family N-acetyltransferase n=1 Tax=Novosphingobium sp. BL-52-GroH TaxID=3349877 RepID=UPI00384A47EA